MTTIMTTTSTVSKATTESESGEAEHRALDTVERVIVDATTDSLQLLAEDKRSIIATENVNAQEEARLSELRARLYEMILSWDVPPVTLEESKRQQVDGTFPVFTGEPSEP